MLDKLCNWLNRNKDKDSLCFLIMKIIYKISYEWIHSVVVIVLTLLMTEYYNIEDYLLFGICLGGIILVEIYYFVLYRYKDYKNQVRKNSDLVLNDCVTATIALDDYINANRNSGKGIFELASNLVTTSMYKTLKEIVKCEIRISIVQQFHEKGRSRKFTMISRKSKKRTSCKKIECKVEYSERKNYYFLKILKDNIDVYVFFNTKEEIDKKFFWKNNKKRSAIYQYIGMAEKIGNDDIAFLLQIDAMEKNAFGKTKDELSVFAENYISPYIQFLKHAYNMERIIKEDDV